MPSSATLQRIHNLAADSLESPALEPRQPSREAEKRVNVSTRQVLHRQRTKRTPGKNLRISAP